MRFLLADFTKCFHGKEHFGINTVAGILNNEGLDQGNLILLLRKGQDLPRSKFKNAECVELSQDLNQASIDALAYAEQSFFAKPDATELLVASYDYQVTSLAKSAKKSPCRKRAFRMTDGQEIIVEVQAENWEFSSIASRETALHVAITAIRAMPDGVLDLTKLRVEMTKLDPCFVRTANEPKNFISVLVSELENAGMVTCFCPKPGQTHLRLTPLAEFESTQKAASHVANDIDASPRKPPGPQQVYYEHIREAGLGPFTGIREAILDNLSEKMEEPIELKFAIREAMVKAGSNIKNRQLHLAITKMVLTAGVALDVDGNPIANERNGKSKLFSALATDWQEKIDCEFILAVLRVAPVKEVDIPHLAFAIYGGRDEEAVNCEDTLDARMDRLLERKLVVCTADGELSIASTASQVHTPILATGTFG
jgi:hypothetical protein